MNKEFDIKLKKTEQMWKFALKVNEDQVRQQMRAKETSNKD